MRSKALLYNLRISTKLLLLNLMICAAFFLIICVVVFSFATVRNKLTEVTNRDMGRAISNSQAAREISKVFADIDLLSRMFYGKNDYLKSEGGKLVSSVNNILESTTDSDLKKSLLSLHNHIEAFLDHCVVVNTVLHAIDSIDRETYAELTSLENLIAELLVNFTIEGEDTAFIEQLLSLVMGYRESLLQIGKLYAELGHEHYFISLEGKTSPVIAATDDLILRLQTITASVPDVARYGEKIVNNVQKYSEAVLRFYEVMEKLNSRMTEINHSKTLLTSAMENIEKKITSAIQLVGKNIEKTIFSSGAAVFVVSIFVVVFLGFATAYLIKSTINNPMQAILKGVESFGKGDFDKQIELSREDEWDTIEKGLNNMAADLLKSYTALRESEEKYRSMMEAMNDEAYICSPDFRVEYMNPAMIRRTGRDATGEPCYSAINALDKPCPWCVHDQVQQGNSLVTEIVSPMDNRHYYVSHSPIFYEDGSISKITIYRDITEWKRLEEQLIQVKKLEAIGILSSGIAHDFNNLLSIIVGYIELVKDEITPEAEAFEFLEEAEKASLQAQELTKQLITFSTGGAPVKQTGSIVDLIKETTNLILAGSSVTSEFFMPHDLYPVQVDIGQMNHAIKNIIINAVESMPDSGSIIVKAENYKISSETIENSLPLSEGEYVKISIRDHGIGISGEHLSKIFDPYFSTKEMGTQKGMGLGLAITYSVINKHEGHITVKSEVGVGTTFTLYLRAHEKDVRELKSIEILKPEKPAIRTGRILLMDDEKMIRNIAKQMPKRFGYEAELAKDGVEAIELYKKAMDSGKPFDAVILDLTIKGGMGGKETVKRLMEIDSQVRAIVSSGYSNDPVMTDFRRYGFIGALPKPYTMKDLSEALDKVTMEKS